MSEYKIKFELLADGLQPDRGEASFHGTGGYINIDGCPYYISNLSEVLVKDTPKQPEHTDNSITESTLIKAIAVAQDPTLAAKLVKKS